MYSNKQIQRALKWRGFYNGNVDGIIGPKTEAAITAFKVSVGYRARPYLGPLTLAALMDNRREPLELTQRVGGWEGRSEPMFEDAPVWLRVASTYEGLDEWGGSKHNPAILEMWRMIRAPFTDDETPWCAAFVGSVLEECNIASTRSAAARSYENYGVPLSGPCVGAIGVLSRGEPTNGKGHVIFIVGRDENGNIVGIGGNQGNKVSVAPFNVERFLAYRFPKSSSMPDQIGFDSLPLIGTKKQLSNNEA